MQLFRFCLLKERTVFMNIQQNRTTALYCRLSRDDDFGGNSVSIQTQKTMLSQYARDNGFTDTEFYVDDGYSGTNFDRPDFCRMIEDIECGKVGAVIVKDLSRLGREYLKTGYYTEIFFPEHDVVSAGEKWCSVRATNPGVIPARYISATASPIVRGIALR